MTTSTEAVTRVTEAETSCRRVTGGRPPGNILSMMYTEAGRVLYTLTNIGTGTPEN